MIFFVLCTARSLFVHDSHFDSTGVCCSIGLFLWELTTENWLDEWLVGTGWMALMFKMNWWVFELSDDWLLFLMTKKSNNWDIFQGPVTHMQSLLPLSSATEERKYFIVQFILKIVIPGHEILFFQNLKGSQ